MHALGIDIGGTGIKAAPVDVTTGKLLADRQKIDTPRPALPDPVADVVKQLTTAFNWSGPVGITFPGVVIDGVTRTAANMDPAWIGLDAAALFAKATGNPVRMLNDVDAAGVAEMTFGAGVDEQGTVLMVTFGTGIGSALFVKGILVPNTEFGHIEIRGRDAEDRASERAKNLHDLSWSKWAEHVDEYLQHIEALLSPDLIIVGGGISRQSEKWVPRLTGIRARIVPAALLNNAGIVGAAMATSSDLVPDASGASGTGHEGLPDEQERPGARPGADRADQGRGGATPPAPPWLAAAGAAVVVIAAAVGITLAVTGGSSGNGLPLAALSTLGNLQPAPAPGAAGPEGVPIPSAAPLAGTATAATRKTGRSIRAIRATSR